MEKTKTNKQKKKKKKTGRNRAFFSDGIQCAAMARDTNTRLILSLYRVSDVGLPNGILI